MSFSYDETKLDKEMNVIRLYLGDTDENDPLLQDEEIIFIQGEKSTLTKRIAACCRLICAHLARKVDYRLSLLSEKAGAMYERYKDQADRYEVMGSLSYPWAGSVDVALKKANEDDTSIVQPKFTKGIHDHPGTK